MSNEKQDNKNMDRRSLLKGAGVAAGATVAAVAVLSSTAAAHCGTCEPKNAAAKPTTCCPAKGKLMFKNSDFYTAGKFDVEKAKDGIIAMCKMHGYPVFPGFRENLWVSDYGLGQYTKLGLAAYMFQNKNDGKDDTYMLMDLFLVPGQMLPEHWHLEGDNSIVKNEGWLVRWGKSYIVGEGKDNLAKFPIKIPKLHMGGKTTTKHVVEAGPGQFVPLAKVKTKHWQWAGPQGAIITEVANLHTDKAVRHQDPAADKYFRKMANGG